MKLISENGTRMYTRDKVQQLYFVNYGNKSPGSIETSNTFTQTAIKFPILPQHFRP